MRARPAVGQTTQLHAIVVQHSALEQVRLVAYGVTQLTKAGAFIKVVACVAHGLTLLFVGCVWVGRAGVGPWGGPGLAIGETGAGDDVTRSFVVARCGAQTQIADAIHVVFAGTRRE
jgi:hypothetical protein